MHGRVGNYSGQHAPLCCYWRARDTARTGPPIPPSPQSHNSALSLPALLPLLMSYRLAQFQGNCLAWPCVRSVAAWHRAWSSKQPAHSRTSTCKKSVRYRHNRRAQAGQTGDSLAHSITCRLKCYAAGGPAFDIKDHKQDMSADSSRSASLLCPSAAQSACHLPIQGLRSDAFCRSVRTYYISPDMSMEKGSTCHGRGRHQAGSGQGKLSVPFQFAASPAMVVTCQAC